jgi:type IV pilus assembly protein PilE
MKQSRSALMNAKRGASGFTLVELMIVVAIVAILAAVAYPSYTRYVARGHRAQVMTQMAAAQQWLERVYSESYRYDQNASGTSVTGATGLFAAQAFAQSPPVGEGDARYTLGVALSGTDNQTYVITATRAGTMVNDECGNFTVTNTGIKGAIDATASDPMATCWR